MRVKPQARRARRWLAGLGKRRKLKLESKLEIEFMLSPMMSPIEFELAIKNEKMN